jgi:hypothetical protein
VISDVHLNNSLMSSMNLMPDKLSILNDLDRPTFYKLIEHISAEIQNGTLNKPKFILYLGDLAGHDRSALNVVLRSESVFFKKLTQEFPDTPILYTFGNDDSFITDYGPFASPFKQGAPSITPLDIARNNPNWKGQFLSTGKVCGAPKQEFPCILSENIREGYYAAYIDPKFRIISLNSVMFSTRQQFAKDSSVTSQFDWLENQLKEAEVNHESVLLTTHIPPGNDVYVDEPFWNEQASMRFLKLVNKYQKTIVAILAAHTHYNEVKIIKDVSSQQNIMGIYLTAALSTAYGNPSSINLLSYERKNNKWDLTNEEIWCFLKNSSLELKLKKIYDFRQTYCTHQTQTMLDCLKNISIETLQRNFFEGNKNYFSPIRFPKNVYIPFTSKISPSN